jgi:hypothetical protein
MNLFCSRRTLVRTMRSLGFLLIISAPARAQTFVELGGGSSFVGPAGAGTSTTNGWNLRASIGLHITPGFSWRFDAFTNQFDTKSNVAEPCPSFGCSGVGSNSQSQSVSGLTANALVGVDPLGIFYLSGGAGFYDVQAAETEWVLGVSAGAGVAVPIAPHIRAFAEARWHGLFGVTSGPSSIVPVTIGLRF